MPPQQPPEQDDAERVDILLIEDDPGYVELARHALLEIAGAEELRTEIATDGESALARLLDEGAQPPPRLVILDLRLPRLSGLEVLMRLRANEETRFLPVVMLTSSRLPDDLREAYRRGANSYVVKPIDFSRYLKTLSSIVGYWLEINEEAPRASTF